MNYNIKKKMEIIKSENGKKPVKNKIKISYKILETGNMSSRFCANSNTPLTITCVFNLMKR